METTTEISQATKRGSLYALKPGFVSALEGIQTRLIRRGVSADRVSIAGLVAAAAAAGGVVAGARFPVAWLAVLPLCGVWMALNALDGSIARATGEASRRGALLNELADRAGDLLILTAGFFVSPWPIPAVALVLVGISELVAAVGWAVTGRRILDGPMPKPDRAIVIGLGATFGFFSAGALGLAYTIVGAGAAAGAMARARTIWLVAGSMDRKETVGRGR
jgi:CDP-diacylglycerol--glycerol-3-phosphate 3-phosphatidyltransferase